MSEHRAQYCLTQMGFEIWQERKEDVGSGLSALAANVAACQACALAKTRTQTVFARGNPAAKLFIVGEAPGFHEDKQGKPFVGRAGKLLDSMLQAIGLDETQVYIANVLKCRPPDNRDPLNGEIEACQGFLKAQIQTIKPTVILGLGRFAGHFLSQSKKTMSQMRNESYHYEGVPAYITFHPAYLLRNPKDKAKAWWDLAELKVRFGDDIAL